MALGVAQENKKETKRGGECEVDGAALERW